MPLPSSRVSVRVPVVADIPAIWALLEDHKAQWIDDFTDFDQQYVFDRFQSNNLLVLDQYGFCKGVVWVCERRGNLWAEVKAVGNLWAEVKAVVRPESKSAAVRIGKQVVSAAFHHFNVARIKVNLWEHSKSRTKVLNRLQFKQICFFRNETMRNGKKLDIYVHELRRNYWEKLNHG